MESDEPVRLEKLAGRQRRPATGDVFRIRVLGGPYYFGLVVDGNMEVGPMAPGSILTVIFQGSSDSGELSDFDALCRRVLLIPPIIVNQRPWTVGYAQKIGQTTARPEIDYTFYSYAFGKYVNQQGQEVANFSYGEFTDPTGKRIKVDPKTLIGTWGVGSEWALADEVMTALSDR